ncbi:MAG TPA: glutamyl-tRNA amidotransferase, partial [Moraxellaceae bacterium]|nr:glutamyl-tRNA amidotransferase [Moraxellaceae bacterium]
QLSDAEIDTLIAEALAATGATTARDMGKVMNELRPKLAGRADTGA